MTSLSSRSSGAANRRYNAASSPACVSSDGFSSPASSAAAVVEVHIVRPDPEGVKQHVAVAGEPRVVPPPQAALPAAGPCRPRRAPVGAAGLRRLRRHQVDDPRRRGPGRGAVVEHDGQHRRKAVGGAEPPAPPLLQVEAVHSSTMTAWDRRCLYVASGFMRGTLRGRGGGGQWTLGALDVGAGADQHGCRVEASTVSVGPRCRCRCAEAACARRSVRWPTLGGASGPFGDFLAEDILCLSQGHAESICQEAT